MYVKERKGRGVIRARHAPSLFTSTSHLIFSSFQDVLSSFVFKYRHLIVYYSKTQLLHKICFVGKVLPII